MSKDFPEDLEHPSCCQHLLGEKDFGAVSVVLGVEEEGKKKCIWLQKHLSSRQHSQAFAKAENKRLTGDQEKKVLERNLFLQEAQ